MTKSPWEQQYEGALKVMLSTRELRIFLWSLVVNDCQLAQADFQFNATAYALLAVQRIGKRLLADAKAINPAAVFQAEQEYNELMKLNAEHHARQTTKMEDIEYGGRDC